MNTTEDTSGWPSYSRYRRHARWFPVIATICWIEAIGSLLAAVVGFLFFLDRGEELTMFIVCGACVLATITWLGLAQAFSSLPEMERTMRITKETLRNMDKTVRDAVQELESIRRKLDSSLDQDRESAT